MLALVLFLRILCLLLPTTVVTLPLTPGSEVARFIGARRDIAPKEIGSLPAYPQRRANELQGVAPSIHQPRAVVSTDQSIQDITNLTINQKQPFSARVSFDAFIDINKGQTETPVGIELVGTVDEQFNIEVETLVWVGAKVHKRVNTVSGNLNNDVPLAISTPYISSTGRLYLKQTTGYYVCIAEFKGFYRLPFVTIATPFYVRKEAFRWLQGFSLSDRYNITLPEGRWIGLSSLVNTTSNLSENDTA